MGLVYLPTWKPSKSIIHVGKYTVPWMVRVYRYTHKPSFATKQHPIFCWGRSVCHGATEFPKRDPPGSTFSKHPKTCSDVRCLEKNNKTCFIEIPRIQVYPKKWNISTILWPGEGIFRPTRSEGVWILRVNRGFFNSDLPMVQSVKHLL